MSHRQYRPPTPASQISPRERRATDKQEPRFHRKHGGVSTFGLTGNRGKECQAQTRANRPENPDGARAKGSGAKKLFPKKVCLRARHRPNCKVRIRIRNCGSRSPITPRPRRWLSSRPSRSLSLPSSRRPSRSKPLRPCLPSPCLPSPRPPSPFQPSLSQPSPSQPSPSQLSPRQPSRHQPSPRR